MNKWKSPVLGIDFTSTGKTRRAPSQLLKVGLNDPLHGLDDSSATNLIQGQCCGGGCCRLPSGAPSPARSPAPLNLDIPDNDAFQSLKLKLSPLSSRSRLSSITPLPVKNISIESVQEPEEHKSTAFTHPPKFVTPHPPYEVFAAKVSCTRELTRPGAPKRTYHFDLDVTDYPEEAEGVDFRVGGAIGVQAPNDFESVDAIFDLLEISQEDRDAPVMLKTEGGRWPTIWGEEEPRTLLTTRRELLTWTVDIQSYPPTKNLLRLLAEYASDEDQKTILLYLCSKQGQAAFCELRTGPYVTLEQLLNAFPSSKPPFDHLLCNLSTLMPRFYSLSNDPHFSRDASHRRIIEIAVTVHESSMRWRPGNRTGVGSGFFERTARKILASPSSTETYHIPMFRGLMANPLAKEFVADGPMLLIGAGVGIAPFRGFVQRRLQNANCVNKVWVLQGVRDSLVDELYSGEWGVHDEQIKKVVESRVGTGRYVQDEVRAQADLVWFVINALDGRVFVCGSSKGMGEGVEEALVDVAMLKGRLSREEAGEFWKKKREGLQYIAETW
ncbi:hypothetical protein BZA05DRAFT_340306 [Tricharina praecox]|uniref:uncharacterized protein n=1 Tax=Tricharina praecox TaxID=43433 RepID=UPI0022205CD4|nr:uncharacterized protein BZA05DRAFT_340306 [Tricharina praecox]KAI5848378.1 hypothetical protein BZA05DRAFT_340306 [Tricharina praecox]